MIHRDDIDANVMAEIEAQLAAMFPGMKVVCAGDVDLPDDVASSMKEFEDKRKQSFYLGLCLDCGEKMPGFPPADNEWDDWQPPPGWKHFTSMGGDEVVAWQCPECDAKETST